MKQLDVALQVPEEFRPLKVDRICKQCDEPFQMSLEHISDVMFGGHCSSACWNESMNEKYRRRSIEHAKTKRWPK